MQTPDSRDLKAQLLAGDPAFWDHLAARTAAAADFSEVFALSGLRKKAHARGLAKPGVVREKLRMALMGGCSLYPFHELLEHFCEMRGFPCEFWRGDFDNYLSEITEEDSHVYTFKPDVALVIPAEARCRYTGNLSDPREMQQVEAARVVNDLLHLLQTLHGRSGAEVIATNFILPARHDLGPYRSRTLGSDWTFRKWVNLELGLAAPPFLHLCDMEFLAHRHGGMRARDDRGWFESKQPCSPELLVEMAREVAHIVESLRRPMKKVLVLDLDNTLWGGVLADDGMEGIEIGDTSPRGEAFKAFQKYVASLRQRGTLLAVASKNDHARALEVFEKHPEMALRMGDFVSLKINWEPKSDNIRQMASDLNLGLDSFVFVDDNPAEIEIVRQFAPEVATILLGPDPSTYAADLQDCRFFEPRNITSEDVERTAQYHSEAQRKALYAAVTDMDSYLESLAMEGIFSEFTPVDAPRLAQLINKSNQFNLTTRRRTEADIHSLAADPEAVAFSVRLKDRFGDHGLISVIIAFRRGEVMEIDTWLMSCRVLKRQVEEAALNELARLAAKRGCTLLRGIYIPTAKNAMVLDFYPRMGFTPVSSGQTETAAFELELARFRPLPTRIRVTRHAYDPA